MAADCAKNGHGDTGAEQGGSQRVERKKSGRKRRGGDRYTGATAA
jgi:hypothetical protein